MEEQKKSKRKSSQEMLLAKLEQQKKLEEEIIKLQASIDEAKKKKMKVVKDEIANYIVANFPFTITDPANAKEQKEMINEFIAAYDKAFPKVEPSSTPETDNKPGQEETLNTPEEHKEENHSSGSIQSNPQ